MAMSARSPLSLAAALGSEMRPVSDAKRRRSTKQTLPLLRPDSRTARRDIDRCLTAGLQRLIAPEGGIGAKIR